MQGHLCDEDWPVRCGFYGRYGDDLESQSNCHISSAIIGVLSQYCHLFHVILVRQTTDKHQ